MNPVWIFLITLAIVVYYGVGVLTLAPLVDDEDSSLLIYAVLFWPVILFILIFAGFLTAIEEIVKKIGGTKWGERKDED